MTTTYLFHILAGYAIGRVIGNDLAALLDAFHNRNTRRW